MNNVNSTRLPLQIALDTVLGYLGNLDRMSVAPTIDLVALQTRFAKPLNEQGIPVEEVISQLVADCEGGVIGSASAFFWVGHRRNAALRNRC